ncbi:hypothetical protein ANCDUO_23783 [Ancylostoma duodenale]|uniref:Uncharacterized protein n=1 Tax=Ancylostoma duodenale TaxID=51022 RepID=A0A0C2FC91_9BILA|nr:hypothetical protein ANCDUO_23783 [Ancylostoma duodenale]
MAPSVLFSWQNYKKIMNQSQSRRFYRTSGLKTENSKLCESSHTRTL